MIAAQTPADVTARVDTPASGNNEGRAYRPLGQRSPAASSAGMRRTTAGGDAARLACCSNGGTPSPWAERDVGARGAAACSLPAGLSGGRAVSVGSTAPVV